MIYKSDNRRFTGVIQQVFDVFDVTDEGSAVFFNVLNKLFG